MTKQPKNRVYWIVGSGITALIVGGLTAGFLLDRGQKSDVPYSANYPVPADKVQVGQINALKSLPAAKRVERLAAIAQAPTLQPSLEQSRARYLLANDLMQQNQPQKAIEQLHNLEAAYPVLAPHILLKRAQAQGLAGDQAAAQRTQQELLQRHPQSSATAGVLVELGQTDPKYWNEAIQKFPAHPRTLEVVQRLLKQNPNQSQLLLVIAKHGLYLDNFLPTLDRLVAEYGKQLSPEDWETIAFGYWEKQDYAKAAQAYVRSPQTAKNAYRVARGLQLGGTGGATAAYQQMVAAYPNAEETGLALMRLARLTDQATAIGYLDQVTQQFPDRAAEALLEKSKLLDKLNNPTAATETRKTLLSRYGTSEAAAELRWTLAQQNAKAKDYKAALAWVSPILTQNRSSDFAPEAGFWAGKWFTLLGQTDEAQKAYEYVLKNHSTSYYAWRSASMLGWEVGDFSTVRELDPDVVRPASRPTLPSGSEALKELYQLGQDSDAWALWQTEFRNPMEPTVAEQFTDGVMRLGVGDFLDGIFMVSFLSERDQPAEQQQYQQLKQQASYWQALYPFPYMDVIETHAEQTRLNPLLVTALIRQESRFMPGIKSPAGAVGLMQVMPDTAMMVANNIKLKQYQLEDPEDNVKLGTWYLDYTHKEYSNNSMLAVASYNAGPGAVGDWLAKQGMTDADEFVEAIPYDETRDYVKSVFGNYWNYLRLYNPAIAQKLAQVSNQAIN